MGNRALTLAEIRAMLNELADKVEEGGKDLYDQIKIKVNTLPDHAEDLKEKLDEVRGDMNVLLSKATEEGREIIARIDERLDNLKEDVAEEIAELKEVGLKAWIKNNKKLAGGLAAGVVVVVIILIAVL